MLIYFFKQRSTLQAQEHLLVKKNLNDLKKKLLELYQQTSQQPKKYIYILCKGFFFQIKKLEELHFLDKKCTRGLSGKSILNKVV